MHVRVLITIAASTIAFAAAHAQGPGDGTMGTLSGTSESPATPGTTMRPGTPGGITPGIGAGTMGTGIGTMRPGTPGANAPSQAQGGSFNASSYGTRTDCLNAAQSARVSRDACGGMKK
jgi:hypothetical protein